jgi:NUMOD4 motif/HNH endonuclease
MFEEWRPIPGFPAYEVSSFGRVKRVINDSKNHGCRILKPWDNNKGYFVVAISDGHKSQKKLVHRLVCEAFHGASPPGKDHSAHGDGNPKNNHPSNLRWVNRSENMDDSRKHGTMALGSKHGRSTKPERTPRGIIHGHAKLSDRDVIEIRSTPKIKGSGIALARRFGVCPATICLIRSGKIWTHLRSGDL